MAGSPCNCVRDVVSSAYRPAPEARQVRFSGSRPVTIRGLSGSVYRFDSLFRLRWVDGQDLDLFEGRPDFEVLERSPQPA